MQRPQSGASVSLAAIWVTAEVYCDEMLGTILIFIPKEAVQAQSGASVSLAAIWVTAEVYCDEMLGTILSFIPTEAVQSILNFGTVPLREGLNGLFELLFGLAQPTKKSE